MEKPTYKELEKKLAVYQQKLSHLNQLEDQLKSLENQFLQVEKQLIQHQRMDSLGVLAHGVAHDFNNILSGIMAYLNILSLTSDNFTSSQKIYVQNIINAVKRGAATVKKFQTLSNTTISEKANIDIYPVVKEVFQLIEETSDKLIEKKLDIQKDQFIICADSNEIHQVFMNLATNAIHAIEEKGVQKGDFIRFRANRLPVKGSTLQHLSQGEFYEFMFEDSGTGMPEQVVKKVFDPLFTTKKGPEIKGHGLGLAMVRDIVVKRHDGYIEIDSRMGSGTTFHIYLPKSEHTCGLTPVPLSIQGGSETILVVDDDEDLRIGIKAALEDFGYGVILAEDGEEGLEKFKAYQGRINAVLLDMIMPRMSGKQMLRSLLSLDPMVKVIISSGHMEDQLNDIILKSAKNYLKKPFEIDELENTIRQVLDDNQG